MALLQPSDSDLGIGNGSTWGTAPDFTSGSNGEILYADNCNVSHSINLYRVAQGTSRPTDIKRLAHGVGVTLNGRAHYNDRWMQVLANLMGTSTASPAEQNVGEGDYLHNIDMNSETYGLFQSLSFTHETDEVTEVPSCKWASGQIVFTVNDVVSYSFSGIGDKALYSESDTVVNNASDVTGLTTPTPSPICFMSDNLYVRINSQSGSELSSSNDLEVVSVTLAITREGMTNDFVTRGANTKYVIEPKQGGLTTVTAAFQFAELSQAKYDVLSQWATGAELKGELFVDGDAIASGKNESILVQMPRMIVASNTGADLTRGRVFAPLMTCELFKAASAPTGMTGVTDLRVAMSTTRSAALI